MTSSLAQMRELRQHMAAALVTQDAVDRLATLTAVLPDLLARAWDEGRRAGANLGLSIGERVVGVRADWPAVPPNPYRQEANHG